MPDLLTGLDTRHELHLRLPEYAAAATSTSPLSLLLLSVRDHQLWRQRLTPLAADRLFATAADAVRCSAPANAYSVLWDSSCFGVLLPDCPQWKAEEIGENMRRSLHTSPLPAVLEMQNIEMDFCYGAAAAPPQDANDLTLQAERQLRRAEGGVFQKMRLALEDEAAENIRRTSAEACIKLAEQFLLHGDPYLSRHGQMTAGFAASAARRLGLTEAQILELNLAATFADLTMSEAAGSALNKPGCLTMGELNRIKLHPELSAQLVTGLGLPQGVVDCVRCHHENMDGSGYPNGLRGSSIPLAASILSASSAYAAMLLPRPYRPARKAYRAKAELSAGVDVFWPREVVREVLAV